MSPAENKIGNHKSVINIDSDNTCVTVTGYLLADLQKQKNAKNIGKYKHILYKSKQLLQVWGLIQLM